MCPLPLSGFVLLVLIPKVLLWRDAEDRWLEWWAESANTVSRGLSHWYWKTIWGLKIWDKCLYHIYGDPTHFEWTKMQHRGLRYDFLLKFLLEYYCDTEQRGPIRVLFINRGHFTGYFLRESAEMPHRFLEAKPEGSGNFYGKSTDTYLRWTHWMVWK